MYAYVIYLFYNCYHFVLKFLILQLMALCNKKLFSGEVMKERWRHMEQINLQSLSLYPLHIYAFRVFHLLSLKFLNITTFSSNKKNLVMETPELLKQLYFLSNETPADCSCNICRDFSNTAFI